jgi:hypothetical protein
MSPENVIGEKLGNFVMQMGFSLHQSSITHVPELETNVMGKLKELGLSEADFKPMQYLLFPSCLFASLCHALIKSS